LLVLTATDKDASHWRSGFTRESIGDNRKPRVGVKFARLRPIAKTQIAAVSILSGRMAGFLLLFDLDGTLVDTLPDLCAALNEALDESGRPPLSANAVKGFVGDGAAALVARAARARALDPTEAASLLPRFLEIYAARLTRLSRPYPEVPETLGLLRGRGYRAAVCTNKPQRAAEAVLRGLGLAEFFDAVAGGDRFAERKPDPRHLLRLLSLLGGSVARSAMIGDNENDALAAHAAAMPVLLARYGYARGDPEALGGDAVIERFGELPAALERLGLGP
jgi:phosphoglycolate phosphatase